MARDPAEEILGETPGRLAAVGLSAAVAAVNEGAVAHLLVTDEGMIPGFVCGRCGALSAGRDQCPDWGTAARAVPDLLEEMVQRTLDDDGQVTVIRDAPVQRRREAALLGHWGRDRTMNATATAAVRAGTYG